MQGEQADSRWLEVSYDWFAPVRKEAERSSEEEIDAAIDQAVQAIRVGDGMHTDEG